MADTEGFKQTPPDGDIGPLQIGWADIATITAGAYYGDGLPVHNSIVTPPEARVRLQRIALLGANAEALAEYHAMRDPDASLDAFIAHLTATHIEAGMAPGVALHVTAAFRLGILLGRQEGLFASFEQSLKAK